MSVADEILRIQQAKSDLATSIAAKGVTVPAATTIDGYAALVDQIQQGGSTLPFDAVIEYIQSSGTQYIDLGKKLDSSKDIIDIKFRLVGQVSATSGFFGARNDASSKNFSVLVASSNNIILDMNNGSYANYRVNSGSTGYNKTCDIQMYQNYKIVYFDLNEAASSTTNSQSFVTDSNAELFRVSNLPMPSVRLQSFKWRQTGIGWIYDMIPVRVGQVGYMYDKISGALFGNDGTGSFTLGPDVILINNI